MLYKNKNIIAKLKNKNGSLIQDDDENIFLNAHTTPPFRFFSLATMFLFLYSIRTATYQKIRTFHSAVVLK
jgi:hypothetical protein